jgi:flagellar hook-length control protein FliK
LAFPATHAISSSPAAHHAHGAKAHGKDGGAGGFADLLAAADAPGEEAQAAPAVTAKAVAQAPDAQADTVEDGGGGVAVPAETPVILAAMPQAPEKPQAATPPEKKDDKDPQAGPAVKDDDAMVPPPPTAIPPAVMPPPQPVAAAPNTAASGADMVTPLATANATASAAGAPQPQMQTPASQPDSGGEETEAAGAQLAAGTAGAKAKPAGDFKKTPDDAKAATAKTAPAKGAPDTAPAQTANSHAGGAAGVHADAGQGDAHTADAQPPAPAMATANANPQPGVMAAALPPAHAAAQAPAPQPAAMPMPMPQHVPNMPTPNMNGLAVDIAAKSLGGARQFDIRLDPPELGRVEVRLSIDAAGKASAHLTADQPQTLDLLQKDASTLTRALRDAGLNVNQNGLNFSLRSQQSHAGNERQHRSSGGRAIRAGFAAPASLQPVAAAAASSGRSGRGLLDIKV